MPRTADSLRSSWRPHRWLGPLATLVVACAGEGDGPRAAPPSLDAGARTDANTAPDAGLKPGASLENCRTPEGARLCGTKVNCFEHGPDCECIGRDPKFDRRVPDAEVGLCGGILSLGTEASFLLFCRDGDVRASPAVGGLWGCTSAPLARVFWLHGFGEGFRYADGTPYDGTPIPSSDVCPPPDGDLELCGGDCGGCSKPGFYCSGRSPTHPLGLCTTHDSGWNADTPGTQRLKLATAMSFDAPSVWVRDCARLAATVPGGAICIEPL